MDFSSACIVKSVDHYIECATNFFIMRMDIYTMWWSRDFGVTNEILDDVEFTLKTIFLNDWSQMLFYQCLHYVLCVVLDEQFLLLNKL